MLVRIVLAQEMRTFSAKLSRRFRVRHSTWCALVLPQAELSACSLLKQLYLALKLFAVDSSDRFLVRLLENTSEASTRFRLRRCSVDLHKFPKRLLRSLKGETQLSINPATHLAERTNRKWLSWARDVFFCKHHAVAHGENLDVEFARIESSSHEQQVLLTIAVFQQLDRFLLRLTTLRQQQQSQIMLLLLLLKMLFVIARHWAKPLLRGNNNRVTAKGDNS